MTTNVPSRAVASAMRSAARMGVDPYNSVQAQAKRLERILADRLRRLDQKVEDLRHGAR